MTNTDDLTVIQDKAIQLLMMGLSDQAVADKLGLARQTVCNWKNRHQVFAMELGRQQKELRRESQRQLWGLVADSMELFTEAMLTPGRVVVVSPR